MIPTTPAGRERLSHHIAKFFADPGREFKKDLERAEREKEEADRRFKHQMSIAEDGWVAEITQKEEDIDRLQRSLDDQRAAADERVAAMEAQLKKAEEDLQVEKETAKQKAEQDALRKSGLLRVAICVAIALALELILVFYVLRDGEGKSPFERISKNLTMLGLPQLPVLVFAWFFVGKNRFAALGWPFDKVLK